MDKVRLGGWFIELLSLSRKAFHAEAIRKKEISKKGEFDQRQLLVSFRSVNCNCLNPNNLSSSSYCSMFRFLHQLSWKNGARSCQSEAEEREDEKKTEGLMRAECGLCEPLFQSPNPLMIQSCVLFIYTSLINAIHSIKMVAKTINNNGNSTETNEQASIYAPTTSRMKFGSSSSLLNPITLSHRFRDAIINDDLNLAKRIYERAIQSSNPFPIQMQDGDGENGIGSALLSNAPHLYSPPRRQSDISTNSTLNGNLNQTSNNNHHRFNFVPSLNLKENTRLTASQRAFIAQSKINSSNSNSNFVFDVRNVSNNIHHQSSPGSVSSHNRTSNASILTGIGPILYSIGNGRDIMNHHHSGKGKKKEESLQSRLERTSSLILAVKKDASIDLIEWLLDQGHERLGEPSRVSHTSRIRSHGIIGKLNN